MTVEEDNNKSYVDKLIILVSKSYEQAINDFIWKELWLETIKIELIALIVNKTWDIVISLKNVNIITSKWVFKVKMHVDDTLNKLKVRLVARDFSQMFEMNFIDIFASTIKFDTLRLFLVIVALKDLEYYQVNINNAFINFFLKKIIYMKSSSNVNLSSNQALLIRRNLYDLKQTARDWHEYCVKKLRKLDFEQSVVDSCMLIHKKQSIILLVYIDDIFIAAKSLNQIK